MAPHNFSYFEDCPPELQLLVWEEALNGGTIIVIPDKHEQLAPTLRGSNAGSIMSMLKLTGFLGIVASKIRDRFSSMHIRRHDQPLMRPQPALVDYSRTMFVVTSDHCLTEGIVDARDALPKIRHIGLIAKGQPLKTGCSVWPTQSVLAIVKKYPELLSLTVLVPMARHDQPRPKYPGKGNVKLLTKGLPEKRKENKAGDTTVIEPEDMFRLRAHRLPGLYDYDINNLSAELKARPSRPLVRIMPLAPEGMTTDYIYLIVDPAMRVNPHRRPMAFGVQSPLPSPWRQWA